MCAYQRKRKPNRIVRWSVFALLMRMKLPLFTFEFGLLKCGVFDRLNASARNSSE